MFLIKNRKLGHGITFPFHLFPELVPIRHFIIHKIYCNEFILKGRYFLKSCLRKKARVQMSTFIVLDSSYRDRQQYPNPANYVVNDTQMSSWFLQGRSIRAFPAEIPNRQLEFVSTIKLLHFVLPYSITLSNIPIIYVDIHTQKYKDRSLVSTISNSQPLVKFVCEFDKYQFNNAMQPVWIHYKCNMSQVMRFSRKSPLTFAVINWDEF